MPGKMCPFKSEAARLSYCNFQCTFYIESENSELRCLIKETLNGLIDVKTDVEKIKSRLGIKD